MRTTSVDPRAQRMPAATAARRRHPPPARRPPPRHPACARGTRGRIAVRVPRATMPWQCRPGEHEPSGARRASMSSGLAKRAPSRSSMRPRWASSDHSASPPSARHPNARAVAPCSSTVSRPAGCAGPGSARSVPHRTPRACTGHRSASRRLSERLGHRHPQAPRCAMTSRARFSSTTGAPSARAVSDTTTSAGAPCRLSAVNSSCRRCRSRSAWSARRSAPGARPR